jgi:hypothetical protein
MFTLPSNVTLVCEETQTRVSSKQTELTDLLLPDELLFYRQYHPSPSEY